MNCFMTNEHVKCAATEQHHGPITARDDWLVPSLQVRQLPRTSTKKQYLHAPNAQALKEKHQTHRRVLRDSRSRGKVFDVWSVSEYHSGHLCWQTSTVNNAKWEITQLREKCSNQSSAKPVLDGLYHYKRKVTYGVDSPPEFQSDQGKNTTCRLFWLGMNISVIFQEQSQTFAGSSCFITVIEFLDWTKECICWQYSSIIESFIDGKNNWQIKW